MANEVVTWDDVRRALVQLIAEPFYRYYPQGVVLQTGAVSGTTVRVPELAHAFGRSNTARGMFMYAPDYHDARQILHYNWEEQSVILDSSPSFGAGDTVEILHTHPQVLLDACNRAIRSAYPYFYLRKTAVRLVPEKGEEVRLPSDLMDLLSARVERSTAAQRLTVASYNATTFTVTVKESFTFDSSHTYGLGFGSGALVSEYYGVSSADPNAKTITLLSAPPLDPVADDIVYLVDETRSDKVWDPVEGASLSQGAKHPAWLLYAEVYDTSYSPWGYVHLGLDARIRAGRRLMVEYLALPPPFKFNSDLFTWEHSIVPVEYVARQAAYELLMNNMLPSAAADSDVFQWLGRWNAQEAQRVLRQLAMPRPAKEFFPWRHEHRRVRHVRRPFG